MIISSKDHKSKPIDVVGCFILSKGKILLLHRNDKESEGSYWGLPGGKVNDGESKEEAIVREIFEETQLKLSFNDLKYHDKVSVSQRSLDFTYYMYSVDLDVQPQVKISKHEHKGFIWTSPIKALEMNLIHDLDICIRSFFKI
jgi:8-oxo-dGTP diphosphatase